MSPEPTPVPALLDGLQLTADGLSNLASGLLGAFIGAAIAFAASLWLQRREFSHRGRGAARAIYDECRSNIVRMRIADSGGPGDPLTRTVFDAVVDDLASWLPAPDFADVAVVYSSHPAYDRYRAARAGGSLTEADEKSLRSLIRMTREARDILRKRAWTDRDYRAMKKRADEGKAKLGADL